jgi:hypothetical protein
MTEEAHVPTEHSDLVGGSTAGRRIACPASYSLEKLVPKDDKGSPAAREGTVLHEIMTKVLTDPDLDPYSILPFEFTHKDGWTYTVDEDTWEKLGEPALDAFLDYMDEVEARTAGSFRYVVEKQCKMPGIPGAFGTSDIIWRCGPLAGVWDWKFGFWGVAAEKNPQLQFYARAAMDTYPDMFEGVTDLELAIMQPARDEKPDTWLTTPEELEQFRIQLLAAIEEAKVGLPGAKMEKGAHCKYARCMAVCPLHADPAIQLAQKLAARKADEASIPKDEPKLREDEALGNEPTFIEMLPDLLTLAELAEAYASEVFARAHRLAEEDTRYRDALREAGWVLKDKKPGARQWALPRDELIKLAKNRGLNMDVVAPRKLATPKKVEDALAEKGKKLPDDWAKVPPSSGTTLVRQTGYVKEHQSGVDVAQQLGEKLAHLRG